MTRSDNPAPRDRRGLGRGLSVLMGNLGLDAENAAQAVQPETPASSGPGETPANGTADGQPDARDRSASEPAKAPAGIHSVPIEFIRTNAGQPRQRFPEDELDELAESMRRNGMIQPILVRPDPDDGTAYQIVAGERRWRAAQRAQLHEVPVLVRILDDRQVLEVAMVENVQRTDLNPVEEATGYRQLMEEFGHTQASLSEVVGKSRSHVANSVRLLGLPEAVQTLLRDGQLSAGHARAILGANDPEGLARRVVEEGLSVRQTESLVASEGHAETEGRRNAGSRTKDADTRALEAELSANLRLKVSINHKTSGSAGSVRISYRSLDELDALCRRLGAPESPVES
ncbi:MAG: ParB/RepB/Spo0J family partition protein [Paracoccaceae bacterium]|nr:ParB/RepB/Spo0J family partition protein [Paracoccaceae bacterium]